MLVKTAHSERLERSRRRERRRHAALPLRATWKKPTAPAPEDWMAAYPCTRMHGAAFEAEFYSAVADSI